MLLDTASLYFRAFFGVPDTITAPDGTPVNAIRGFLDMTTTLVGRFSPRRVVACLDFDWRPAWRVELVPSYKAHRLAEESTVEEVVPDALAVQVPVLLEILAALGIATEGAAGYEADDVIGTLATRERGPVDIVTGDRDLFQLVDDSTGARVLYTGRGVAKLELIDEAEVRRRYGISASQYADFAVMRGDPSDGLPGVPGVGEKTAAGLLASYGSLEEILRVLDRGGVGMPAAACRRLSAAREYLQVAPPVVRVACDIPLPEQDDALPAKAADPVKLAALAEQWGLESPVKRILDTLESVGGR
jgi:5'-3' exonuclease